MFWFLFVFWFCFVGVCVCVGDCVIDLVTVGVTVCDVLVLLFDCSRSCL